ncbi:hemolysin XhlA family protein [Priestia sp. YIM B13486]|uniref:hemolysin XhlA family protein n=1 Tax=Priestia sp. YIM B13486 TaxID=3366304 RepID=UPI00366A87CA
MPKSTEGQPIETVHKELTEIKGKIDTLAARVYAVERTLDKHDQQIITLNEKLSKIEDNTTWIKCTIMGGIITAICTGVIGGAIAIFYTVLQQ